MSQDLSQFDGPTEVEGERSSPFAHRVLFFLLASLAFVLFAPAVLLPVLQDHCNLLGEEKRLAARIAELDVQAKRRAQLAEAFAHDEIVNERLAQLDLHYEKPGEVIIAVPAANVAAPGAAAADPATKPPPIVLPADWPDWAHRAQQWADERGLIGLFLDSTLRPIFFLMSAGLLIAAFVLFAPEIKSRSAPDRPAPSPGNPAESGAPT